MRRALKLGTQLLLYGGFAAFLGWLSASPAYDYASAEMGCFLELGWPIPENMIDTYDEFRNLTNGWPTPAGSGLLGTLAYYGLKGGASATKDKMRDLAIRGGWPVSGSAWATLAVPSRYCA